MTSKSIGSFDLYMFDVRCSRLNFLNIVQALKTTLDCLKKPRKIVKTNAITFEATSKTEGILEMEHFFTIILDPSVVQSSTWYIGTLYLQRVSFGRKRDN